MTSSQSSERHWYLSVTAVWKKAGGWDESKDTILDLAEMRAAHQMILPEEALHCTIISLIEISNWPFKKTTQDTAEDYARQLLNNLEKHFERPEKTIELTGDELKCYDDVLSIRFQQNDILADYQIKLLRKIKEPVDRLCDEEADKGQDVKPLLQFMGGKAYGSLARSPCLDEKRNVLKWKTSIKDKDIKLSFDDKSIVLAASDQAEARRWDNGIFPERS